MTRMQMLEAYEKRNKKRNRELSYGIICKGIYDGLVAYDPINDTISITVEGRIEAQKRGRKIVEIH